MTAPGRTRRVRSRANRPFGYASYQTRFACRGNGSTGNRLAEQLVQLPGRVGLLRLPRTPNDVACAPGTTAQPIRTMSGQAVIAATATARRPPGWRRRWPPRTTIRASTAGSWSSTSSRSCPRRPRRPGGSAWVSAGPSCPRSDATAWTWCYVAMTTTTSGTTPVRGTNAGAGHAAPLWSAPVSPASTRSLGYVHMVVANGGLQPRRLRRGHGRRQRDLRRRPGGPGLPRHTGRRGVQGRATGSEIGAWSAVTDPDAVHCLQGIAQRSRPRPRATAPAGGPISMNYYQHARARPPQPCRIPPPVLFDSSRGRDAAGTACCTATASGADPRTQLIPR